MIARSQLLLSYYNSLEDLLNIPEILTLEPVLNNHFDKYMPAYTHLRDYRLNCFRVHWIQNSFTFCVTLCKHVTQLY